MDIEVAIPEGFIALPVRDVEGPLRQVEQLYAEFGSGRLGAVAPLVLQAMRVLLGQLSALGAVYCGLGRHYAADGSVVTSTLVVTGDSYGPPRNPRLTIADYVLARTGEYDNCEVVQFAGKHVLLSGRVMRLPAPEWGDREGGRDVPVYQIEAVVPSADGSKVVVIELSTPFVDKGEEFLSVVLAISSSIEIRESAAQAPAPSLNM